MSTGLDNKFDHQNQASSQVFEKDYSILSLQR